MRVWVLEIDYGTGFEFESAHATEESATQAGEKVVTFSATGVKYRISEVLVT